jgi:dipeptidyl-peptidase-3
MPEHKKDEVVGITYNVVSVAGEAGDASPSTPIGVNLPNSNWIRVVHGSKSVSLGNIVEAYDRASGGGILNEFAHDDHGNGNEQGTWSVGWQIAHGHARGDWPRLWKT